MGIILLGTVTASAEDIKYLSYDENSHTFMTATHDCNVLTSGNDDWEGWLVAKGNIVISKRVVVNEDVHLILADGCKVTCTRALRSKPAGFRGRMTRT